VKSARKPAARKPSAAELARREAQSQADRGEAPSVIEVTVDGITVDVDVEAVDDYDAVYAFNSGDVQPLLKILIPDDEARATALDKLREESGKLRMSRVWQFVNSVFGAIQAGKS
jgi:hypothetical protein